MIMKLLFVILFLSVLSCNDDSTTVTINGVTSKTIPGLTAVDVHGNLTNKGFFLTKNLSEVSTWTCKKYEPYEQTVMVTGKGPTDIVSVDATVLSFLDSLDVEYAGQFLGYIASIQYKGANPQKAKDWVIRNINNSSETNIGGVNFRLIANSDKNRILKMYMSE